MSLDSRTLLVSVTLIHCLAMASLLFAWTFRKTYAGFGYWVGSLAAMATAAALLTFRGLIPDLLSVVVANALAFLAFVLQLHATRLLLGRKAPGPLPWILLVLSVTAVALLTVSRPDFRLRIILANGFAFLFFIIIAAELLRRPPPRLAQASRLTGAVILIYAAVNALRLGSGLFGSSEAGYLTAHFVTSGSLLLIVAGTLLPFGVLMLNQQRLESDFAESEARVSTMSEEVEVLKGFIPICSACKKIRDDAGFWNEVETYVRKAAEAQFSHGMCPDCITQWYPGLSDPSEDD